MTETPTPDTPDGEQQYGEYRETPGNSEEEQLVEPDEYERDSENEAEGE